MAMNKLSKESSPYLLQHAHNPVHWHAWNDAAWEKARSENKLVLISIGYSACHWCHVMEREVFEDHECAEVMNMYFVCIKVDREERPDVDAVYMDALHVMGQRGGWPLNVFTLPDGRPVYGGTYFPKRQWLGLLDQLISLRRTDEVKLNQYAAQMQQAFQALYSPANRTASELPDHEFLDQTVEHWKQYWDETEGGNRRAPKFPMPSNWQFLLAYGVRRRDRASVDFVHFTLEKMAMGGIYDQLGGGFARYSVDAEWKVPHFEKMLYDNAQLLALYADAYKVWPQLLYADTMKGIHLWLKREMVSEEGLFFSALDADSEGEEGKYYTWTAEEWQEHFPEWFTQWMNIGAAALWEHGRNIPLRKKSDDAQSAALGVDVTELYRLFEMEKQKALALRAARVAPGLDYKCILSWNAQMISGLCTAYEATGDEAYKNTAMRCAQAWLQLRDEHGIWPHAVTNGRVQAQTFLEDYAFLATAWVDLYECSWEEVWLHRAEALVNEAVAHYYDPADGLFRLATGSDFQWSGMKKEIQDNVIPSSNAVMCRLLRRLGIHLRNETWQAMAVQMLERVLPAVDYASGYSHWMLSAIEHITPSPEIVLIGAEAAANAARMQRHFIPGRIIAASTLASSLPLLADKKTAEDGIYVCHAGTCYAPAHTVDEAFALLQ